MEDLDAGGLVVILNGYGMERRLEENSSLERPATKTWPLTYLIDVIVSMRCRSPCGPSGRLTEEYLILSSGTSEILPAESTRTITGIASVPCRVRQRCRCFRDRIDHQVVDADLVRGRAEHRRNLFVNSLHFKARSGLACGTIVDVEGVNGGSGGIADEEHAPRTDGPRTG